MLQLEAKRELRSNVLLFLYLKRRNFYFRFPFGISGCHNLFDEKTGLQTDFSFCNFVENSSYTVKITDEIKSELVFLEKKKKSVQPFIQLTCNFPNS